VTGMNSNIVSMREAVGLDDLRHTPCLRCAACTDRAAAGKSINRSAPQPPRVIQSWSACSADAVSVLRDFSAASQPHAAAAATVVETVCGVIAVDSASVNSEIYW